MIIMKKLFALLLAVTMLFALAACGEKESTPSGSTQAPVSSTQAPGNTQAPGSSQQAEQTGDKSWPSIAYLKAEDKYTGDGKITQVKEWDASAGNEMWTVYYNDATFESVESYVAGLVSAGWTNHYADEDGNYMENTTEKGTARTYYCTCDYAEVEIQVGDFSNSMSFTDEAEFSFNLSIQFSKA